MNRGNKNIQRWNRAAKKYCRDMRDVGTDLGAIYQPAIDGLLGDVRQKRILDAGCGEGYYCRKLALKKASVTGIDGSKEMITLARNKKTEVKVDYKVMDLTHKLNFPDAEFDVVLANMVLMDVPKIDIAIAEFARILKENGVLVFCITHPCFFCYDWVQDKKGAKLYKPISDYLNENVEELTFWGKTLHYHRPLSYYFDLLEANEFCVASLKEPIPSNELLQKHPEWKFHTRIPSFIALKAMLRCK